MSVDEFVAAALANRLASRQYIESRAHLYVRAKFDQALNQVPDVEPEDYDRL